MIQIDKRKFYIPKIALILCLWCVLSLYQVLVNYTSFYDPNANFQVEEREFSFLLKLLISSLLILYLVYFYTIVYKSIQSVRQMKKNYRIVFYYTLILCTFSSVYLLVIGYKGYGHRSIDFIAIYALFNIYTLNVSFLYSPTWEGFMQMQMQQE